MPSYLGQNFLKDSTYTIYIANLVRQIMTDLSLLGCVEIGPGAGALTKKLIHAEISPLILIEKDDRLAEELQKKIALAKSLTEKDIDVTISRGDVLSLTNEEIVKKTGQNSEKTMVVGNLPYYITSPILTKFFGQGLTDFPAGVCMIQKEVADKIRHDAPKKSYLWRLLNYGYMVKYCKTVPAKAFSPAPKVQSAIISLQKKDSLPEFSFERMKNILDAISGYKRKTLGKCRKMIDPEIATSFPLPEQYASLRLEQLSLEAMGEICRE